MNTNANEQRQVPFFARFRLSYCSLFLSRNMPIYHIMSQYDRQMFTERQIKQGVSGKMAPSELSGLRHLI